MDVCKIGAGLYQYTAIDDCSRYQVVGVFSRKTVASTLTFLEQVVEEMPFSIQRIQTDRGQEFFAYRVQDLLRQWSIKFRPLAPPRSGVFATLPARFTLDSLLAHETAGDKSRGYLGQVVSRWLKAGRIRRTGRSMYEKT